MTLESLILNKAHTLWLLTVIGQKGPSDSTQSQGTLYQRKVTISTSLNDTEGFECIEWVMVPAYVTVV